MNVDLDTPWTYLAVAFAAAVIGSLFGAGSSTIVPLPAVRLATLADKTGPRAARLIRRYSRNPSRFAFRWLVCRIACVSVTAVLTGQAMQRVQAAWSVPVAVLGTLATYGLLVQLFSVLVRRRPSRNIPRLFLVLSPMQPFATALAYPLELLARLNPNQRKSSQVLPIQAPQAELGMLLEEGRKEGTIEPEPLKMIKNLLELRDQKALDVMVPRTMIVAFSTETTVAEAVQTFVDSGHSRYPVYEESIDHVVGLLYAKDLFRAILDPHLLESKVGQFIRKKVNFVPETMPASVLLQEMKRNRQHLAVVVDDFGGVSGIITLEDILEEIVGEIWDEHDPKQNKIRLREDGSAVVDASISIDDLERHLDIRIEHSQDVVSLAGWIVQGKRKVPRTGETLETDDLVLTVQDADDRHVSRVLIARRDGKPLRQLQE